MGLMLERRCSLLCHCGESGAQVTFSSTLPVEGNNIRRNRWAESINTWLHGWCHCQHFGGFDNAMAYAAPGMLASGGIHPSQQGRRVFAQEVAGLTGRALH